MSMSLGIITFLFRNSQYVFVEFKGYTIFELIRNKRFRLQCTTMRIFLLNQNLTLNHLLAR